MADLIKPLDGAIALINCLHRLGCKLAIATTDKTARALLSLTFLGLTGKFDSIIGADAVAHPKPAPDMIEKIIAEVKVAKDCTVMVGDAVTDIEMANNAGIMAGIAVCSGITPREKLAGLTNHVINDVSQIFVKNDSGI